jgi:hypothetical protein
MLENASTAIDSSLKYAYFENDDDDDDDDDEKVARCYIKLVEEEIRCVNMFILAFLLTLYEMFRRNQIVFVVVFL